MTKSRTFEEPWKLGPAALATAYAAGDLDPIEVARLYRDRIERLDGTVNAYVAIAPDMERQAAECARRIRAGEPRSPLEGVPIAVKDNLCVAGLPAAWGSNLFAGRICAADELPVARLRGAGAVLLGKTNTPEFAVEGYTANATFGVTGNPWNPKLTPGGSSGGAVAAVAAGLAAAAIGTDGGGSIRRPAAHTGLYGLKPTIGAVPRHGGLPQILLDFEVVGPLARSAEDLRMLFSTLTGPDRRDPASRARGSPLPRKDRMRVLLVERLDDNPCDAEILASVNDAAERLAKMGHEVVRGALGFDLGALNEAWPKIAQIGLAHLRRTIPAMTEKASPQYLAMADAGDAVAARELFAALEAVRALRARASEAFGEWDLIMTPAIAAQPWPAEEPFPPMIDGHSVGPRGHAVYTGWVNAIGHPAVAIPSRADRNGMPIGFQLVGDLHSEDMLLDVAEAFESAGDGWHFPEMAA